jgi:hypothetical protein
VVLPALVGKGEALLALGRAGGLCDGGETCTDALETAAGWPLFGRFIAHDITADRSPLTGHAENSDAVSFRRPTADLERLYGGARPGPRTSTGATTQHSCCSVAMTAARKPTCRGTPKESR